MGLFKESLNTGLQYSYLIKFGFEYGLKSGARAESGYIKIIRHNGNEMLWITVNPIERKVYLYNELDCGGVLWQRTHDIPKSILGNERKFVEWLDEIIGDD